MNHSDECTEITKNQKETHDAWVEKWPNHCTECHGYGVFYWSGGQWGLDGVDPCGSCQEEELKCPRCGEEIPEDWIENDAMFECCGWNWGRSLDDYQPAPYPYEGDPCPCEEEAMNKYYNDGYFKDSI